MGYAHAPFAPDRSDHGNHEDHGPRDRETEYGFGFGVQEGGRVVGHSGGFNGINSQLDIYVGEDYTLAVMSNYGDGAQPIIDKARTLMLAGQGRTASR